MSDITTYHRGQRNFGTGYDMIDQIEALEAKLAKAVEAFNMLVRDCEADYPPSHGAIKHFAIATLAEIKGDTP